MSDTAGLAKTPSRMYAAKALMGSASSTPQQSSLHPLAPPPSPPQIGVVALTFFDLRRRSLCGPNLSIVSTDGSKHPSIKEHFTKNIEAVYRDMSTTYTGYPSPGIRDAEAYKTAIDALSPGDAVTVFTPDSTHFEIAKYAMQRGCHVMITKPAVKKLEDHLELVKLAREKGVLCYVEHHKRFDPAYADARER